MHVLLLFSKYNILTIQRDSLTIERDFLLSELHCINEHVWRPELSRVLSSTTQWCKMNTTSVLDGYILEKSMMIHYVCQETKSCEFEPSFHAIAVLFVLMFVIVEFSLNYFHEELSKRVHNALVPVEDERCETKHVCLHPKPYSTTRPIDTPLHTQRC